MARVNKCDDNKRNDQPYKLVFSLDNERKRTREIGGELLIDLKLPSDEVCNTADDVTEHNTNERHKHGILDLDPLNEEHK